MKTNGWELIDETNGVYAYTASAVEPEESKVVFENFYIDGASVDNTKLEAYVEAEIVVTAYPIQANGFNTAAEAWTAAGAEATANK